MSGESIGTVASTHETIRAAFKANLPFHLRNLGLTLIQWKPALKGTNWKSYSIALRPTILQKRQKDPLPIGPE